MKRFLLLTLIIAAITSFFWFDLHQLLTLNSLKQYQQQFAEFHSQSPWLLAAMYFVIYVLVTALSLPGAAIMTLAGGAVFGLLSGFLLVSFASSIGATLAFLVSRFILRDSIEQRFDKQLENINDGLQKDGAFYLFTLRLVPLFPFFLINLVMGLTRLPTRTFYWVSQLGMLPGTLVYINAGVQLGAIESTKDILSPALLLSFTLLGMFPVLAKKSIEIIKQRQVYKRWKKPKRFDRNLIVIGGGAAGLVSAYIAATVKAKVTLVETHKMGGDCLNYGCVPSKALIRSAKLAQQIKHAGRYGLDLKIEPGTPKLSFKTVMARVHSVIAAVEPHDSVERYTQLGVEVLQGYAKILDPWTVEITHHEGTKQILTTRNIIIATGARPFVPPLPGLEDCGYVTSDTLWEKFSALEHAPKRLVILGGGPIGCELAQSFTRLGSHVTQIEMASRLMMREDEEVSAYARASLEADGVQVLTAHKALRCQKMESGENQIIVEYKGREISIYYDELICAVGRVARLEGYGLEELGLPTQRTVQTNEYLETLYPNIFAAGDVAGPYQFTHTAAHMAWYAAVNALFGDFKKFKVDYSVIPWATFIDPEVARVGLNEQEAKEKNIAYEVTRYGIDDLDRAMADSAAHGFVKVLTAPGKDKILGVTIVGEHAAELLAEFVLAMKHGLGLNKILSTIHTYPTWSEANKYVAGEWKKAHAPQTLLRWSEKYHAWKRGS